MSTPSNTVWRRLGHGLIIRLATVLVNLWFATCRVTVVGRSFHERFILGERSVVGATWHRNALFLVWYFRRQRPMIMISPSRDGDLLAGFAARLGIVPVRGSSSRGGQAALQAMQRFLESSGGGKAATVLDGPRGPRLVAKKGMIVLAKETGIPLLPIAMSAAPAWTLMKTWDRTLIPLPFSRVVVMYREPWEVPPDLDEAGLEAMRREVETVLNRMRREADTLAGYRDPDAPAAPGPERRSP
jgi:lysophospholipid acyltransferase (LPLAT)-like uncharacterized protein